MFKKCYAEYAGKNQYKMHLWTEEGYSVEPYRVPAYIECSEREAEYQGLKGEWLKKTYNWDKDNPRLHFHDMPAYQKFLIEKYGTDDNVSKGHREVFFDIEIEMGGALTEEYIQSAPKPVTSIAWYDKTPDEWVILILDKKGQINHTKGHKEIIPVATEEELLATFVEKFSEIQPDILVGWNSDYFDIPYLYYRICNVLGEDFANALSPIGVVKDESQWNRNGWLNIAGVESLDYMKLHKKFSFRDEPSMRLEIVMSTQLELFNSVPFVDEVEEFNDLMNKPNNYEPTIPEKKEWEFVYNFVLEELEEYREACERGDIVEVLDALCDIAYVSFGNGTMLHGLKDKIWPAYQEVQASNLSKACSTEEEAKATVKQRSKEQGTACHYEKVGDKYIVYRSHDRKVMKNINYFRPNLKQFFTENELKNV